MRRQTFLGVTVLAGLLPVVVAAPSRAEGYTFEPRKQGDMEARLEVRVADRGPAPGQARVSLTMTVTGGPALEVEVGSPRKDPEAPWKPDRAYSSWALEAGRATWSRTIDLVQIKPGVVPLPPVKARLRDGPGRSGGWEEVEWPDVLGELRPAPPPAGLGPDVSPSHRPWLPLLLALALVGALALTGAGWAVWRRRARPAVPLSPAARALRELDLAEVAGPQGPGEAERYHDRLAEVVRRYVEERFGIPATRQTSAELLTSARGVTELPDPQRDLLRDVLERCDLARFARAGLPAEECRRTAARARAFVEQTGSFV